MNWKATPWRWRAVVARDVEGEAGRVQRVGVGRLRVAPRAAPGSGCPHRAGDQGRACPRSRAPPPRRTAPARAPRAAARGTGAAVARGRARPCAGRGEPVARSSGNARGARAVGLSRSPADSKISVEPGGWSTSSALGLRGVEAVEARQLGAVLAVQAHHLGRGEHAPEVGLRVVAEVGQQPVGLRVAVGRRVEVDLRVAHVRPRRRRTARSAGSRSPCGTRRPRGPRAELAPSRSAGSARRRPAPCAGSKRSSTRRRCARSRSNALRRASRAARMILARQPLALLDVDPHAEQVHRRLGEDLRQARRRPRRRCSPSPRPAGALEEDHRLDEVGVDARLGGGRLDLRPVGLDPARVASTPSGLFS